MEGGNNSSSRLADTQRDQIFFIYDKTALKSEWDNPETAILFFSPSTIDLQEKCSLCGQLAGLTAFTENVLSSKPSVFKLRKGKFAVKCISNYIMVLGGKLSDQDSLLSKLLEYSYSIFQFYHCSFKLVTKECLDFEVLSRRLSYIWNSYLPFVKHYRQDLFTFLDTVPYFDFKKAGSFVYLKAIKILEACQRRSYVFCGCIITDGMVIASQVQPQILRYLTLLKPNQDHFPAKQIETESCLPHGVRIFPVHLLLEEYTKITSSAEKSPYTKNTNISEEKKYGESQTTSKIAGNLDKNGLLIIDKSLAKKRNLVKSDESDRALKVRSRTLTQNPDRSTEEAEGDGLEKLQSKSSDSSVTTSVENVQLKSNSSSIGSSVLQASDIDNLIRKVRSLSNATSDGSVSETELSLAAIRDAAIFDTPDGESIWDLEFGGQPEDLQACVNKFNQSYLENLRNPNFLHPNMQMNGPNRAKHEEMKNIRRNHGKIIGKKSSPANQQSCESMASHSENTTKDKLKSSFKNLKRNVSMTSARHNDTETPNGIDKSGCIKENGFDEDVKYRNGINISTTSNDDRQNDESSDRSFNANGSHSSDGSSQRISNEKSINCLEIEAIAVEKKVREEEMDVAVSGKGFAGGKSSAAPMDKETVCDEPQAKHENDNFENSQECVDRIKEKENLHKYEHLQIENKNLHDFGDREKENEKLRECDVNTQSENTNLPESRNMHSNYEKSKELDYVLNENKKLPECGNINIENANLQEFEQIHDQSTEDENHTKSRQQTEDKISSIPITNSRTYDKTTSLPTSSLTKNIEREMLTCEKGGVEEDTSHCGMESGPSRGSGRQRIESKDTLNENEETGCDDGNDEECKEGLNSLHLYVQAHSNTVLVLFLKPQLEYDKKSLKSIYETVLPQLAELEVHVQSFVDSREGGPVEDFVYLRNHKTQKKCKSNCKFISQKDWFFGQTVEMIHSQFVNSPQFMDATFRNYAGAVYGRRTSDQETYYQLRGSYKPVQGAPTPYDMSCVMDRRVAGKLRRDDLETVI